MIMKKTLIASLCLFFALAGWGQAKKPTLMVIPSDAYCIEKGFFIETNDQGMKRKDPDYRRALQEDPDLRAIISGINNYMADQSFPLADLEATLKDLETQDMEEEEMVDKAGNDLQESRLDQIRRRAKADIVLDLYFAIKRNGPEKIMTFNLKGLDSYTNKQVAGVECVGKPGVMTNVEVLLREDNYARMTEFHDRLQKHFDDLFKDGREVTVVIRMASDAPVGFDTEYGENELSELLDEWFQAHTVKGRYTVTELNDVRMAFTARIPLYNEKGKAMDTREFVQQLRKHLKAAPFNLSAKVQPRGLGQSYLIIGSSK
jgi:Family of unknown function (DUF6175)